MRSPANWAATILPDTNMPGFDLWHLARTQDWALHTLVRGVPEVIGDPQWAEKGGLTTPGLGVGMTQEEANQLAHEVTKADVLPYADTAHARLMDWLSTSDEGVVECAPDIMAHYQTHPEYLTPAMQAEVPWVATPTGVALFDARSGACPRSSG